jgi:hypothetical protein
MARISSFSHLSGQVTCTETPLNNAQHSVEKNANEKTIVELVAQYEWKQETSLNLTDRRDIACTLDEFFSNAR